MRKLSSVSGFSGRRERLRALMCSLQSGLLTCAYLVDVSVNCN